MNWKSDYTARFYGEFVDPVTWRDIGRFEIEDGSVSRQDTGLRQSASMSVDEFEDFTESLVRIYVDAVQGENIEHDPLFTGYAMNPTVQINGNIRTQNIECYSVLKPAEDVLLPRGWYAPRGANGDRVIQDLLSVLKAPVEVNISSQLDHNIVAEDNETRLSMVDKLLNATGSVLTIAGDGIVSIVPRSDEVVTVFNPDDNDVIEPTLTVEHNWFDAPNVFRAVMDNASATERDDSESSELSTVNRGREVWQQEDVAELSNETLAQYAKRRLKEAQAVGTRLTYTRRFSPDIQIEDVIGFNYSQIQGNYRIKSQSWNLSHSMETSEESERV